MAVKDSITRGRIHHVLEGFGPLNALAQLFHTFGADQLALQQAGLLALVAGTLHLNHAVEHTAAQQLLGVGRVNGGIGGIHAFFCRLQNVRSGKLLKLYLVVIQHFRTLGSDGIDIPAGEFLLKD